MAPGARPRLAAQPTTCYRAVVAYDGTGYRGFQRQAGATPTVQGVLEDAIARVTGQPVALRAAGRTDTGVHASGQVIAFDVTWAHGAEALWRALNANLPRDVAVQALSEAEAGFHPRYAARSRTYQYTLYVAPVRHPLLNNYAWHVPARGPLDLQAMQQAAALLVGVHDFATFGQPPRGDNTIRQVRRSEFATVAGPIEGVQVIRYVIEADAFLYRMVRRIVGALVRVGTGSLTPGEFERAWRAADASWPNPTAPAHGLCLVHVTY